jgi:hypothetical protein
LHLTRINFESWKFTPYEIHSDFNPKKEIGFFLLSFKCNIIYVSLYIYIYVYINEVLLLRVKEQRHILHEISKWKANWIGHILRRNCLLKQVIAGEIKEGLEVTGRRGRRRGKLLDDLKE